MMPDMDRAIFYVWIDISQATSFVKDGDDIVANFHNGTRIVFSGDNKIHLLTLMALLDNDRQ